MTTQEAYEQIKAYFAKTDRIAYDVDQLTPLDDDEYCSCCGQIGCGWS